METPCCNLISISKACRLYDISVRKVLDYLSNTYVIPKESQRKRKSFIVTEQIHLYSDGSTIRVDPDNLIKYLLSKKPLDYFRYNDYTIDFLDQIIDPKIKFKRLNEIKNERLLFIDAEFKEGNYHEIAWEIWENGRKVEEEYHLERKHLYKMFLNGKSPNDFKRYRRLKNTGKIFSISRRKVINSRLKKAVKSAKYIIAHNSFGERSILIKNGIKEEKVRFLDTAKISQGFLFEKKKNGDPSLIDLVNKLEIKNDPSLAHFAFEDVRVTAIAFFKMLELSHKEFDYGDN